MQVEPDEKSPVAKADVPRKAPARTKAADRKSVAKKAPAKKVAAKKVVAKQAPAKTSSTTVKRDGAAPMVGDKPRKKPKLIRDSFTMPQEDWALIGALKSRALNFKRATKKSELLRAGLQALAGLDDKALKARLDQLEPLKVGRPKGG